MFVNAHGFLQLFSRRAVQTFLVVDPAESVGEARHARIRLHRALREPHRFVHVAFVVFRVEPREIVGGKDCVLVFRQRLTIVVDGRVDVLTIHLKHADQRVRRGVVGTLLDNLGVLSNRAILLVRVHE